jgi:PAS domain S-box-containing protein
MFSKLITYFVKSLHDSTLFRNAYLIGAFCSLIIFIISNIFLTYHNLSVLTTEQLLINDSISFLFSAIIFIVFLFFIKREQRIHHKMRQSLTEMAQLELQIKRQSQELFTTTEKLYNSEELIRSLFNAITEAAFLIDLKGTILTANHATSKRYNIPLSEIIGECIYTMEPEELMLLKKVKIQNAISSGSPVQYENEQNGKYYSNFIYPVFNIKGDIYSTAIFIRDITSQKQIENDLYRSKDMLQKVLDNIPMRIFWKDRHDLFLGGNQAFAKDIGVKDLTHIIGKSDSVLPGHARPLLNSTEDQLIMIRDLAKIDYEEHQTLENGSKVLLKTSKIPLHDPDGCVVGLLGIYDDITEQRKLQRQQEWFFKLSLDFLSVSGFDGHFLQLNPIWFNTFGWTKEELLARPSIEFIHPEDRESTKDTSQFLCDGQSIISFENRFLCKDGSFKWLSWNSFPVTDQNLIYAVARDVSEKKRMESVLKHNTLRLTKLLDLSEKAHQLTENEIIRDVLEHAVSLTESENAYFMFFNPERNNINFYTFLSESNQHIESTFDSSDHFSSDDVWTDCIRFKRPVIQNDILNSNFKKGYLSKYYDITHHLGVPIIKNSHVQLVIGVCNKNANYNEIDIMQLQLLSFDIWKILLRRRIEQQLFESETRYRTLAESAQDPIFLLYPDLRFHYLNQYAARTFNIKSIDCMNKSITDLFPPEKTSLVNKLNQVIAHNQSCTSEDCILINNAPTWLNTVLTPVKSISGEVISILGISRDITGQKKAEAELAHQTEELIRSNKELEQFAYAASHDLRSPLRAIESLAQWIEEDLRERCSEQELKYLSLLRIRTSRLDKLLSDLLEYSRAGKISYTTEHIIIADLLRNIQSLLNMQNDFILVINTMPEFITNRIPLERIFLNLISNAMKHHDKKPGTITIRCKEIDMMYEFSVEDDGPGIPPEFHIKVFEIFQTLKSRDDVEGSGMGLAIVKKLVENYGGTIRLESMPPHGCKFIFTWPKHIDVFIYEESLECQTTTC